MILTKNNFIWLIAILVVVAFLPAITKAAECPALSAGDLFKVPNNSAVYLLNSDMERMYFPHSSVYKTWYDDFSAVIEIPNTCVDNYPAPSAPPYGVNYRPGSKLVKVQISPSVYVVEPGNKLSKIGSEDVASLLYGTNWAQKVVDIADVFWPNYANRGSDISTAIPHNGMLVKIFSNENVYHVENGKLVLVDGELADNIKVDVNEISEEVFSKLTESESATSPDKIDDNPSQSDIAEKTTEEDVVIEAPIEKETGAVRITNASGVSSDPSIVWTGSKYGLVWEDTRGGGKEEIFFALLDENGNKVIGDTQITNTPTLISSNPEIIWNGSEFAIVYAEYSEGVALKAKVNFVRVNASGSKIGNIVELSTEVDKPNPSIDWDGNGYGIIWRTPNNTNAKTYFSYVNANGEILKSQVQVVSDEASDQTEIVWDGDMFAIIYRQEQKVLGYGDTANFTVGTYLHRIDKNGNAERNTRFVSSEQAMATDWDGTNYVVVEKDKTFSIFNVNANFLINNAKVSSDGLSNSDIAFDSGQYGIVGERDGFVYFVEVGQDGLVDQSEMKMNDKLNTNSMKPRIDWSGTSYGVVWSDDKDNNGGGEIYFRAMKSN